MTPRMTRWPLTLLLVLRLSTPAVAQAQTEAPAPDAARQYALEPVQGAWDVRELREAASSWNAVREAQPANAEAQFNYFKATRNAALATNNGSLPAAARKELSGVADALQRSAPGSFESCMANYHLAYPAPAAFSELDKAYRMEPDRLELIPPMLGRAMLDGDPAGRLRWSRALRTRGGLAPALTDVAADLLQSVDAYGVVFTNGDMDTHPVVAAQEVDGLRKDVLVVDQRLLADAGYRQRVWSDAQASGKPPGPGPEYARTLSTSTARPVYLALSIDPSWTRALQGQLYPTGLALRVSPRDFNNLPLLEQRWPLLRKPANAGPLSRNYLLPASVLLEHYRAIGDEEGAARMEHELRRFGDRIGATQDLYKAGILKH